MSEVYPHVSQRADEARFWSRRWSLVVEGLMTAAAFCLGGLAGFLIWVAAGGPAGRPAVGATVLLGLVASAAFRSALGPLLTRFRGSFIAGVLGHELGCEGCADIAGGVSRSNARQDP